MSFSMLSLPLHCSVDLHIVLFVMSFSHTVMLTLCVKQPYVPCCICCVYKCRVSLVQQRFWPQDFCVPSTLRKKQRCIHYANAGWSVPSPQQNVVLSIITRWWTPNLPCCQKLVASRYRLPQHGLVTSRLETLRYNLLLQCYILSAKAPTCTERGCSVIHVWLRGCGGQCRW